MKLNARGITSFLARPDPAVRLVLVYGPESGLVQERAAQLTRHYINDMADPLAVTIFTAAQLAADQAAFFDETQSFSLLGPSRRVLRIHNADDTCLLALKAYLASPDNPDLRVVAVAGNLPPRSGLRMLAEKEPNAAALPCYVEEVGALADFIRETASMEGYRFEVSALTYTATQLVGDRLLARRQLDKLMIYKGIDDKLITLNDVMAVIPDLAQHYLDDFVTHAYDGNWPHLFRALDRLMEDNTSFMLLLRSLQNYALRLEHVQHAVRAGMAIEDAVKGLQPPLFFKNERPFRVHLQSWTMSRLAKLQKNLIDIEIDLKRYGSEATAPLLGQWLLQTMSPAKAA